MASNLIAVIERLETVMKALTPDGPTPQKPYIVFDEAKNLPEGASGHHGVWFEGFGAPEHVEWGTVILDHSFEMHVRYRTAGKSDRDVKFAMINEAVEITKEILNQHGTFGASTQILRVEDYDFDELDSDDRDIVISLVARVEE